MEFYESLKKVKMCKIQCDTLYKLLLKAKKTKKCSHRDDDDDFVDFCTF
jgi:hypothetical protein